jgi:hypothetical protein
LITKNQNGYTIDIEYDCYTGCVVGSKTLIVYGNDRSGSQYTTTILQCCTTSYCNIYIDTNGNGNGDVQPNKGNENNNGNGSTKRDKPYFLFISFLTSFYLINN